MTAISCGSGKTHSVGGWKSHVRRQKGHSGLRQIAESCVPSKEQTLFQVCQGDIQSCWVWVYCIKQAQISERKVHKNLSGKSNDLQRRKDPFWVLVSWYVLDLSPSKCSLSWHHFSFPIFSAVRHQRWMLTCKRACARVCVCLCMCTCTVLKY